MKKVAVIGATSAVAQQIALIHAKAEDSLVLVGRNEKALRDTAADLTLRGADECKPITSDLIDFAGHKSLVSKLFAAFDGLDRVYLVHGTLPDQLECESDYEKAKDAFEANCLSQISLLTEISDKMKEQKSGTIAVITSVAGDRGRKSNYVYGAAKGMLSIYLQGLRNALFEHGVHVLDVRPGFIDTPMTAHIENKGPLWATPQKVASDIAKAATKKKNTLYTPWFWSIIMRIIRSIPEFQFKKMNL